MGDPRTSSARALGATFEVALGNSHERDHNTLVLSGIDLVVPLEIDLDCDPLHDDEVRLASEDGAFERVLLSSDPHVTPDAAKRLLLYRFRAVPPGLYRLAVKVGERWSDLVVGLVVSARGAFLGDRALGDGEPEAPDEPDEPDEFDDVMDGNDGHQGGGA